MSAAVDAVVAFLKAVNAALSIVPALVWAVVLLLAVAWGSLMHHERDSAQAARDAAVGEKRQIVAQLEQQKHDAKTLYDSLKAERDALQAKLDSDRKAQEARDAKNQSVIADQDRRLRALAAAAPGGQLRDPNGAGCGRGSASAEGAAPASAGGGAADAGQAGGLLSTQLSGLLLRLVREADAVNAAYESCRADALSVRGLPVVPPPAADPAGAAGTP